MEINQFVAVTDDPEFCLGTTLLYIDTRNSGSACRLHLYIFIIICCLICSFSITSVSIFRVFVVSRFLFKLFGVLSVDIWDTDFWPSCLPDSREVASFMEKSKFTALASRASGTSINDTRVFNRWRSFAADVLGIGAFPVDPIHCTLFLHYLLDSTNSVSSINCALYAFKWLHELAGVNSPTSYPTVVAVKEGAVRLALSPVKHRKEPLEAEHLRNFAAAQFSYVCFGLLGFSQIF